VTGTARSRRWAACSRRRGERGWLRIEAKLTPEPTPRLQSLVVEAVLDPSSALTAAAEWVLKAAADGTPLPSDLTLDASFDFARHTRTARAATARFGAMGLGLPTAGDGTATATWSLATERGGKAQLRVALDKAAGALREAALDVAERMTPSEGW
jgi:hypothetical protein